MTVYVSITTLHYTQIVHFHCPKVTSINHFLSSLLAIWMQFISLQGYTNTKLDNCAYFSRTSEQCSTCNIQIVGNDLFFFTSFSATKLFTSMIFNFQGQSFPLIVNLYFYCLVIHKYKSYDFCFLEFIEISCVT